MIHDKVEREERFPISADVRLTDEQADFAELAVIDLSRCGLGVDGPLQFPPDTHVRIDFPNGTVRTGKTRRRDTFTSGIAFDFPLTDDQLCALWASLRRQPIFPRQGMN